MRALMIAAALAFTTAAPAVQAQTSGTNPAPAPKAQCQGPDGKDATNAKCKGAGPAPAAAAVYKLDAKGVCRDANGKAVKKANCRPPSEQ
jgi:hypothetical protein